MEALEPCMQESVPVERRGISQTALLCRTLLSRSQCTSLRPGKSVSVRVKRMSMLCQRCSEKNNIMAFIRG